MKEIINGMEAEFLDSEPTLSDLQFAVKQQEKIADYERFVDDLLLYLTTGSFTLKKDFPKHREVIFSVIKDLKDENKSLKTENAELQANVKELEDKLFSRTEGDNPETIKINTDFGYGIKVDKSIIEHEKYRITESILKRIVASDVIKFTESENSISGELTVLSDKPNPFYFGEYMSEEKIRSLESQWNRVIRKDK